MKMARKENKAFRVALTYREWMLIIHSFAVVAQPDDVSKAEWAAEEVDRQDLEQKILEQLGKEK
jgi:hypothetical protein